MNSTWKIFRSGTYETTYAYFESPQALARAAIKAPQEEWRRARYARASRTHDRWSGTYTFEEAVELANNGWPEGRALIKKSLYEVEELIRTPGHIRSLEHDVAGYIPDVAAYVAGNPECMFADTVTNVIEQPRTMNLVCGMGYDASISHTTIMSAGMALAALLDYLENRSIRIQLTLSWIVQSGVEQIIVECQMKRTENFLDLEDLIFWMAHPAAFRRFIFSLIEDSPGKQHPHRFHSGYGRAASAPSSINIGKVESRDALLLPALGTVQDRSLAGFFRAYTSYVDAQLTAAYADIRAGKASDMMAWTQQQREQNPSLEG